MRVRSDASPLLGPAKVPVAVIVGDHGSGLRPLISGWGLNLMAGSAGNGSQPRCRPPLPDGRRHSAENVLPTVAADAPVLDQLVRNLVPPMAAAGGRRILANPPSASGVYAVMNAFGAASSARIFSWSLRVDVGEGMGVGIERRGVAQAAGQRFGRAAVSGGFVGGAEDRVPRSAGRWIPGLHRKAMDLRCRSGVNAFLILIASCSYQRQERV